MSAMRGMRMSFLSPEWTEEERGPLVEEEPKSKKQKEAAASTAANMATTERNSNAIQELLAGVNTSMFMSSFGVALGLLGKHLMPVSIFVAVLAASVLLLTIFRFSQMLTLWGAWQIQPLSFIVIFFLLLGSQVSAISVVLLWR